MAVLQWKGPLILLVMGSIVLVSYLTFFSSPMRAGAPRSGEARAG